MCTGIRCLTRHGCVIGKTSVCRKVMHWKIPWPHIENSTGNVSNIPPHIFHSVPCFFFLSLFQSSLHRPNIPLPLSLQCDLFLPLLYQTFIRIIIRSLCLAVLFLSQYIVPHCFGVLWAMTRVSFPQTLPLSRNPVGGFYWNYALTSCQCSFVLSTFLLLVIWTWRRLVCHLLKDAECFVAENGPYICDFVAVIDN